MKKIEKITDKNIEKLNTTIDFELFSQACEKMAGISRGQNGIGTLQEKTIHSVLKYYYAPNPNYHEIKIGSYVADICIDGEIFEVQTRNFNTMRDKLKYFLTDHEVTIIYPVAHHKWLSWLDMETGELSPKRKSPKTGSIYNIIPELYKIKMFLSNPRLHFIIALIDVEEVRYLNGWSKNKKKGSTRMDGFPIGIFDEIRIDTMSDYLKFIPDFLNDNFTSSDISKAAKIPADRASTLLNVLMETGVIERVGKQGHSYLYAKKKS